MKNQMKSSTNKQIVCYERFLSNTRNNYIKAKCYKSQSNLLVRTNSYIILSIYPLERRLLVAFQPD